MDPAIRLLRDLVSIDSVNPTLVPGGTGEAAIADRIATALRAAGLDVQVTEVATGRPNVVGVLEGRTPGRTLMLCGHMDTVGVEGMTAPFEPVERDGCLFGRGAQDMKGGLAAMIDAATRLATDGGLERGRLIVAAVVDEEHASLGADALARGQSADGAVVTEPTDLAVATCHKGFEWVEVETRGRSAHGSRPDEGRDAILLMGRVLARLEAINVGLMTGSGHPLLGWASLHASTIDGGRELSVYPDRCRLQFERRTLMGEPPEVGLTEVQTALAELGRKDVEFEASVRQLFSRSAYEIGDDQPVCRALVEVLRRQDRDATATGMSFWTDAAILAQAGTPAVLFGPRGAGLHGPEEFVEIESVLTCRDVLADLARDFC